MDYPYDRPDFSPFLKAHLQILRKFPPLAEPVDFYLEAIDDDLAPAAAALLHTLAHHSRPRIDLVWRGFFYRGDDSEGLDEEDIGDWERYNVSEDAPNRFDPSKGFLLGCSAGGEVYDGFCFDGGALRFFEVDVEDELGEPIKVFETAEAFWDHVWESEYDWGEDEGVEAPEFLAELYSIAGKTLKWPE